MYDKKVSFVVPAYNASKYIKICVDSLLDQSLENIEVIVVDDGSTDDTLKILNNFNDDRLRVISKQNEGASSARNIGIGLARGEFIINIDSDDFVERNYAKDAYEMAVKFDTDVVVTDMIRDYKTHQKYITDFKIDDGIIDKNEYFKRLIVSKGVCHNAVNKLVRSSLLKAIPFPNGIFLGDDLDTTLKFVYKARKIAKLNKAYYHYRMGENNTSAFESLKGIKDHKFVYDDLIKFCNDNGVNDDKIISMLEFRKIKGVYLPLIFCKADLSNKNYIIGLKILKDDICKILRSSGFKKLRMKYKFLLYLVSKIKNDQKICKIFNTFNKINNIFSGRKISEFKA